MEKRIFKKFTQLKKLLVFTLMCTLMSSLAVAQTVVTGKVTDSKKGTPVAGVTVAVKGGKASTQTGADGSFRLSVPAGSGTLIFTSVGYAAQEAAVSSVMNVGLTESAQQLTDVVVVAYGTRRKTDLTGAVTQVNAKDFQKGNIKRYFRN